MSEIHKQGGHSTLCILQAMVRLRHPEVGIRRPVLADDFSSILHYILGFGLNTQPRNGLPSRAQRQ